MPRITNHRGDLTRVWLAASILSLTAATTTAGGKYRPHIDPANFQTTIDNPYYPLVPGTTRKYIEKAGKRAKENEVTVTNDTKVIMGVVCVVVHDLVRVDGAVKEETFDWFAQDEEGNVWYFGEDTKEWHGDKVSTKGSWEAGVGPSQPGIVMPGRAEPGEPYRQEYGPGYAEDMGQIVAVNESVTVPYGSLTNCVRTKEWSLLEAGDEKKWYAPGIGCVKEISPEGDVTELVSFTKAQ